MAKVYLPNLHRTDGVMSGFAQKLDTNIPILLISRQEDFEFNEQILELEGKDFAILDMVEMGWNVPIEETFIVGRNLSHFKEFEQFDGWARLNEFVAQNKPKMYLKRELLAKDVTDTIKPIEYPNFQPIYPTQTKEEFDARPISVMNYWGRSHEARLMLHGEIWKNAARKGYAVCDNIYYYNNFMAEEKSQNKWLSFWIPHYARIPISEILAVNGMSKLSVSLPGCGIKCFRSTGESIVNSICVMPLDFLAYSYPFTHNYDCIKFIPESVDGISKEWKIIEAIEEALQREDLYEIYLRSLKAAAFYQADTYVKYLSNIINES